LQTPARRMAGALNGSVRQVVMVISAFAKSGNEDAATNAV